MQSVNSISVHKQYTTTVQRGIDAIANLDFYRARRFFELADELCPEKREHRKLYLRALRILRKDKTQKFINGPKSTPDLKRADRLLRQVEGKDLKENREKILLLGECGFTFTLALIKKHPNLAKKIIATELLTHDEISQKMDEYIDRNWGSNSIEKDELEGKCAQVERRLWYIKKQGVDVRYGVDATQIHEKFAEYNIESIHWNCPFGDPCKREEFFPVLPAFFQSAAKIQKIGGRIYIGLDQNEGYWQTRQVEYPLLPAAALAGYRLVRKRDFGKNRYFGYHFQKTGSYDDNTRAKTGRQFVFEKVEEPTEESREMIGAVIRDYDGSELLCKDLEKIELVEQKIIGMMDPNEKRYEVGFGCEAEDKGGEYAAFHYVCSTDGDSSC
ncbi:MAG: Rossmann-like fold-containing protein [Candidatus Algichlamydia australiensis]|nr:Rossmann-like fold-containing protein [Chlamydiales bacterium]